METTLYMAAVVVMAIITPAHAGWEGPQIIDACNGHGQYMPQISTGANGNGIAVINDLSGSTWGVYANCYRSGSWLPSAEEPWSFPVGNEVDPRVAVDSQGRGIAVFNWIGPAADYVYASRFDGTSWSLPPQDISGASTSGNSQNPQIAMNANGFAVAIFRRYYDAGSGTAFEHACVNIWNGSSWTGETKINVWDGNIANPQIAVDPNGNAMAVFQQINHIYARHYSGGWEPSALIDAGGAFAAADPKIALDASGNGIAVFQQGDGTSTRIYARRYRSSSGWVTSFEAIDAGGAAGRNAQDPRIAYDGQGNAVAVFLQVDGSLVNRVYANRYVTGSGWSGAEVVDAGTGKFSFTPQIACDSNGNAIAVFAQDDSSVTRRIYANRYENGLGWAGAEIIDGGSYSARDPQISMSSDGNGMAVFMQRDGVLDRAYANRYAAPPTPTPTPTPGPTPTPPIDLTADKTTFATSDRIVVTANVWPILTPCYPFVRVVMADGSTQYYQEGVGFLASPTPYLGFSAGAITVTDPIPGYPCLDAEFRGIATGTYYLEGGAVDATRTTSADNLIYCGTVDRETLAVQ